MDNKEFIIKWLEINTGLNTQSIYDFARKVDELYKQDFNKQLILHDVSCCVCKTPTPERIHGIIKACTNCKKALK